MPWHRVCGPSQEQGVEETHGVGAGSRFSSLPDPAPALGPPLQSQPSSCPIADGIWGSAPPALERSQGEVTGS